jgi:hypothetical protein
VRLLLLTGCTAAAWAAGVLLAGTASADTGFPVSIDAPYISVNTPAAPLKKPAQITGQGRGGLVGGLLGTVTNTVTNAVSTVTATVKAVTATVTTTVKTATTTVNNVGNTVTDIPHKVLPPSDAIGLPPLLPGVGSKIAILKPTPSRSGSSASEAVQRGGGIATVAAPDAAPAAVETPLAAEERSPAQFETRTARPSSGNVVVRVRQVGNMLEKAAPVDRGPSPMPSPTTPMAPVAPSPSFYSGNDGGAGLRGVLATLVPQSRLAPPPLLSRLDRQHPVAERGRTPGLPVTSPD